MNPNTQLIGIFIIVFLTVSGCSNDRNYIHNNQAIQQENNNEPQISSETEEDINREAQRLEAMEGAQIRLLNASQIWGRSDWPHPVVQLRLEARNNGKRYLHLPKNGLSWQIEVDGLWYEWIDPQLYIASKSKEKTIFTSGSGGRLLDFNPGDSHAELTVNISSDWRLIPDGKQKEFAGRRYGGSGWVFVEEQYGEELVFKSGLHSIRVAITCPSSKAGFGILEPVFLVSNPIELEVLSNEKKTNVPNEDESAGIGKSEEDYQTTKSLKQHIDSMKESDRELNKRWDLPEDVLDETPTDKLFLHFMKSPMKGHLMIYTGENEKIGVQRLINSSGIVHELYMRDDLAEGVLKMYREFDFSPESISDESIIEKHSRLLDDPTRREMLDPNNIVYLKIAKICLDIMYADKTLLSPQFFPKLKGYEREFLQVILERYEITSRMDELYAVGDNDYAMARACLPTFCLKLAENLDQEFYNKLKEIEYPNGSGNEQFIEEIKHFLEK